VAYTFEQQPQLPGVIVLENDRVLTVISRQVFLERLSQPYGLEIFLKRSIRSFLLIVKPGEPLQLSGTERIDEAVEKALERSSKQLYEPILVQDPDQDYRLIDFRVLLLAQTQILSLQKQELEQAYGKIRATQTQMIAQEKLASLGSLTAGIAHEIRNPLNFITNYAELADTLTDKLCKQLEQNQEKTLDQNSKDKIFKIMDKLQNNITKINQYGKRAETIISHMLMHYRGGDRKWEPVKINQILAQSVNLAYHGIRAKDPNFNLTFETDYDDSIEEIEAIPQDLNRVFINLISNACYALQQKCKISQESSDLPSHPSEDQSHAFSPLIRIKTENLQDQVRISIQDNGSGIPAEVIPKIFDHFFTTKPSGEGTGLGLSLSYEIITQHQGHIEVRSEVDRYTEFMITLPKKVDSA
jgi:signal transduction histidine kinase